MGDRIERAAVVIIALAHRRPGSTPDPRRAVLVADAAARAVAAEA